jgi:hypothetical protein
MDASDLVSLEQIKQLKARYFRLLDTQQWGEWGQVFTRDARLQWGPRDADAAVGRDAIVAAVSRALEGATSCHHGHMPEIEILGPGRARGIWAMFDRVEAPRFRLEGYGHYDEEYRVEDGAWRIHRSRLTRLHVERGQR